LIGSAKSFSRAGHLLQAPLPGGDKAVLEPWRFALSLLLQTFEKMEALQIALQLWPKEQDKIKLIAQNADKYVKTSSAGRLFDAAASILGLRNKVSYDAQAAIELEAIAKGKECAPFDTIEKGDVLLIDWRPAIRWLIEGMNKKNKAQLAAGFHDGLSKVLVNVSTKLAAQSGIRHVALSGGVWQNRRLLNVTCALLKEAGLIPLIHKRTSPNDECISLGQVAVGLAHWQ